MRTIRLLWRLSGGYRLTPWRSPYLRWRMETYWGLHADRIGFAAFWTFLWNHRADTLRYLRWAAHTADAGSEPRASASGHFQSAVKILNS
jgi:hypothetical protein